MNRVDRELAKIEERRAEAEPKSPASKGKIRMAVERIARDVVLRKVSTKR